MLKKVTFILPAEVVGEAASGLLLGEFNNWDYNDGVKLQKQKDGSMKAVTSLEPGKRYEYRYLLNDGRWVNDHSADHYVHISGLHVENCVINISAETKEAKKAPVKKEKKTTGPAIPEKEKPVKKIAAAKQKSPSVKTKTPTEKTTKKPAAACRR